MTGLLFRLGKFSARRHWSVIIAWVIILAVSGGAYSLFGGAVSSAITIPGTATAQTADLLTQKFPSASGGSGSVVFQTTDGKAFTASQKKAIAAYLKQVDGYKQVKKTTDPFTAQASLDANRKKVTDGQQAVADGQKKLDDSQQQLDAGQKKLDAAQQQLDSQVKQAKAAGQYALAKAQFTAAQTQLNAQQKTIDASQKKIDAGRTKLTNSEKTLAISARLLALSKNFKLVSSDGSAAVGTVSFTKSVNAVDPSIKTKIINGADNAGITGVHVYVSQEIAQGPISVLGPGEVIGLIVAAIVLLIMLSTLIGAALPLLSALLGIGVAVLGALSFSTLVQFISVTPVLGVMLGLAVGIDYSLFILNRHRTHMKQGMELYESVGLANGTSGNAVVFAGMTVIVALLALNITGIPFLGLMGTVGAAAIAVAILVATSFTPALLGLVGNRILRKKERVNNKPAGAVTEVSLRPMKTWRAAITLIAGIAVLGVIALPALSMRLGLPDGSSEPVDSSAYKSYDTIRTSFGAGQNGPLLVVAQLPKKLSGDDLLTQEATLGEKIANVKNVVSVLPIGASADGTVIAFQAIPKDGPTSITTEQLVKDLRSLSPVSTSDGSVKLGVAGNASANIDVSEKLGNVLPLYLVVVLGLSLLILILVFRSLLVPLTATLGFVLSLLATFGGLTAIYQYGWLSSIFGVHDPGPILSFLPIIEIGVLFGLAMDYQLFLVSGMREAWAHGASPRIAVRQGLHAGRNVVTAAAIIMISVFSGFIFSDSAIIRPIGFGLAFGVLTDAFIVRLLLIPAVMHLLGPAAWWFPKWLDRIVPNADVEGSKLERSHPIIIRDADDNSR